MEKNDRVVAICSIKNGVCLSYGEGVYLGDLVPDKSPFNEVGLKNPCIKLDQGKYIWGFQCWWLSVEQFKKKYGELTCNLVEVGDGEVLPVNNKN